VQRVQAWRQAHPGYWRRCQRRAADALQETSTTQPAVPQAVVEQDDLVALQEPWAAQSPLWVGLISHLTGSALQEDIATTTRQLHSRGQAVLGQNARRPIYGKTSADHGSGAARAAPV
jgi:hypothetical protein